MICHCCNSYQITPIESFIKPHNHKYIKLKENKTIHLLHFNESAKIKQNINTNINTNSSNSSSNNEVVIVQQPKLINLNESSNIDKKSKSDCEFTKVAALSSVAQSPIESNNELKRISNVASVSLNLKSDESSKQSDNNSNDKPNDEIIDNFTKLVNSKKLKLKLSDSFYVLEGIEPIGYSIFYKSLIKLDTTKNPATNNQDFRNSKPFPLIFYIHGVGGNSKIWLNQLEFFNSRGYEMIAIDLFGHGESDGPKILKNYLFLEMAFDVLQIFDMFCKEENIIIGHSYGCSFSTYLAQNRKNLVSKLILISGGSPHPLDYKNPLLHTPSCFIQLIQPILNCHFYCSAFSSYFNKPKMAKEAFNISSKTLLYTMKGQIWPAATEEYHKTISQPVLLIEGENDKFVPIEDALDMIRVIQYGYLAVLDKGSHMILIERHETINNLILLFLNDTFT